MYGSLFTYRSTQSDALVLLSLRRASLHAVLPTPTIVFLYIIAARCVVVYMQDATVKWMMIGRRGDQLSSYTTNFSRCKLQKLLKFSSFHLEHRSGRQVSVSIPENAAILNII